MYNLWGPAPNACDVAIADGSYLPNSEAGLSLPSTCATQEHTDTLHIEGARYDRSTEVPPGAYGLWIANGCWFYRAPHRIPLPDDPSRRSLLRQDDRHWELVTPLEASYALTIRMLHAVNPELIWATPEDMAAFHTAIVNAYPDPIKVTIEGDETVAVMPVTGFYGQFIRINRGRIDTETVNQGVGTVRFSLRHYATLCHALIYRFRGGLPWVNGEPDWDPITVSNIDALADLPLETLHFFSKEYDAHGQKRTAAPAVQGFNRMGINTLFDLLLHLPINYTRNGLQPASEEGPVILFGFVREVNGKRIVLVDQDGKVYRIRLSEFGSHIKNASSFLGSWVIVKATWHTTYGLGNGELQFWSYGDPIEVIGKYKQSGVHRVTHEDVTSAVTELLMRLDTDDDSLTGDMIRLFKQLHRPGSLGEIDDTRHALANIELGAVLAYRDRIRETKGYVNAPELRVDDTTWEMILDEAPPWPLTSGQRDVLTSLRTRLETPVASTTLLSADVGTGKTAVIALLAVMAAKAGHQTAIIAPTVLLGQQVGEVVKRIAEPLGIGVAIVGAKMGVKAQRELNAAIAGGQTHIVVGTLKITKLSFDRLGLVAIDEQHKFGVEQRSALLNANPDGLTPHMVMQTATPIPQSMHQSHIGDIAIEIIDTPPSGRAGITTRAVPLASDVFIHNTSHPVWSEVREAIDRGEAVFVVAPTIKDAKHGAGVETIFEALRDGPLNGYRLDMLHGRVDREMQEDVLNRMRDHKLDVLVASTIIEVGIDIPHATHMIIVGAEHLGAASLHQLRGRVGRSSLPGFCTLVYQPGSADATDRMASLVKFREGSKVAEADLRRRGPGHILGAVQAGANELRFTKFLTPTAIAAANEVRTRPGASVFGEAYWKSIMKEEPIV